MRRWDDHARTLKVGVGDLVLRTAASGELAMSTRGRLREGQRVHREVTLSESERWVKVSVAVRGWTVTVAGRIDGIEQGEHYTLIEELKSTSLQAEQLERLSGVPEWEDQLRIYLWMAEQLRWARPMGQVRAVSLVDGSQKIWSVPPDPSCGEAILTRLDAWIFARERWLHWQGIRRDTPVIAAHSSWRPGQEQILAASRDAVLEGRHLGVMAPTGVGKTAAVLTGVLQAAAHRGLGVYWATAKGTQQWVIETTAKAMIAAGTPMRVVTLRARERACCNTLAPLDCRAEACRFAQGLAMPEAVEQLQDQRTVVGVDADALAARLDVCPYELAVVYGAAADLVIGDYNQAFDPDHTLRRLFDEREWVIIVDEAHQLPERALGYGSPGLTLADCGLALPGDAWEAMRGLAREVAKRIEEAGWGAEEAETGVELDVSIWSEMLDRVDGLAVDHLRMRGQVSEDDWLLWRDFARTLARFVRALERAGEETAVIWTAEGLRLVCRDPAPVLSPAFAGFVASISMSATLAPAWYHAARCGITDRWSTLAVPSPFPPENRRVCVINGVSTAYKHRERDRSKLRAVLEALVERTSGNLAIYFGSYAQREDLMLGLETGGRWVLAPRDAQEERERVVQTLGEREDVLLATVLGGVFAEGVDLPNRSLGTVVIVGPALPPPSTERRLMQAWLEGRWELGRELAYVQPGMVRVVQAAGRVVRGPEDTGTVWLVCERFLRREFATYLPEEWVVERISAQRLG